MSRELDIARELVRLLEEREIFEQKPEDKVLLLNLRPGETFFIGNREFIVLEQSNCETKAISKEFWIEHEKYDDDETEYSKSRLKKLIENKIQPEIEKAVGSEKLVEHEVHLISVDGQTKFKPVKCKVRPISFDEVRKFNSLVVNEKLPDWYWTLTPWSTKERGYRDRIVAAVSPSGDFDILDCDCATGVRPFCILKSNIFVLRGK